MVNQLTSRNAYGRLLVMPVLKRLTNYGEYMKKQFDTLEQIADYVDTCVCENFDIHGAPDKFDTLAELVATYCDDVAMSRADYCEVVRLCDTPSIRRLVK